MIEVKKSSSYYKGDSIIYKVIVEEKLAYYNLDFMSIVFL